MDPEKVGFHLGSNFILREIFEEAAHAKPGIIDQNVKAARLRRYLLNNLIDRGIVRHVKGYNSCARLAPLQLQLQITLFGKISHAGIYNMASRT
jgi:hypothetical protein